MSEPSDRRVPRGLGPEHDVEMFINLPGTTVIRTTDLRVEAPTLAEHRRPPDVATMVSATHAPYEGGRFVRAEKIPTLAEHAELVQSDPLAGVPMRGLLRICWAVTRAGFRDAWARLRYHLRGHGL